MMSAVVLLALVVAALSSPVDLIPELQLKQSLKDQINSVQNLWRAEVPKEYRKVMHVRHAKLSPEAVEAEPVVAATIPESFDSLTNWPACTSIGKIRDQANCGSCWAVAAAEVFSDRLCIGSKGKVQVSIGTDDVLDCCGDACGYGCEGGWPDKAWNFYMKNGSCTGGEYYDKTGCKPYSIKPCGKTVDANGETHNHYCIMGERPAPSCKKACSNADYTVTYTNDKYYAKSSYAVAANNVNAIKTEIMTNGPVEAAFTVYQDFYYYTSGIYKQTTDKAVGGHAVKIVGWGVENGTAYWRVANSWNESFGENGYFRIVLGTDECGIESAIVAGLPDV